MSRTLALFLSASCAATGCTGLYNVGTDPALGQQPQVVADGGDAGSPSDAGAFDAGPADAGTLGLPCVAQCDGTDDCEPGQRCPDSCFTCPCPGTCIAEVVVVDGGAAPGTTECGVLCSEGQFCLRRYGGIDGGPGLYPVSCVVLPPNCNANPTCSTCPGADTLCGPTSCRQITVGTDGGNYVDCWGA